MSKTIRRKNVSFWWTKQEYLQSYEHDWSYGSIYCRTEQDYARNTRIYYTDKWHAAPYSQTLKHAEKNKRRAAETRKIKAYRGSGWIEFEKLYDNIWNWS